MRIAFLVPAPDNPTEWRWAYDPQAAALEAAGMGVVPVPWTDAADADGFELIMPLLAWGITPATPNGWRCSIRSSGRARRWPTRPR